MLKLLKRKQNEHDQQEWNKFILNKKKSYAAHKRSTTFACKNSILIFVAHIHKYNCLHYAEVIHMVKHAALK